MFFIEFSWDQSTLPDALYISKLAKRKRCC